MEQEERDKIEEYVKNAYNAVHSRTRLAISKKLADSREKLAITGDLFSSTLFFETIEIKAEQVKVLVEARARATMEAYEIHGVSLEDSILTESQQIYENMLGSAVAEIRRDPVLSGMRDLQDSALEQLHRRTSDVMNELACELEERKAMQKKKQESSTTIQMHGPNARANINSVDNSVNSVTITAQNVFSETRNAIRSEVPEAEQTEILDRLTALENSIHKPTAMQRYKEFAALASGYGNLLLLLPKLLEMAKHAVKSL